MDTVNASGLMIENGAGGLEESLDTFKKHHSDVADKLLNMSGIGTSTGEPVKMTAPRPAYVHQAWPTMRFHHTKGEAVAFNQQELDELYRSGYRDEPYPKPQIAIHDPKIEKQQLQDDLKRKDGELAQLSDVLQRALARLEALEGKQFDQEHVSEVEAKRSKK